MMKGLAGALALFMALGAGVPSPASAAQPKAPAVQPATTRYALPATEVWDMPAASGEVYRIFVSRPDNDEAPPEDGYPVLYVLDGNAYFAAFAQARWTQEHLPIGKAIIVGVGYPGDEAWDERRLYDYTPALLDPPPRHLRGLAGYRSGGRAAFLEFMLGPLRSEIERRYRTDPERHSLFGHSLGGLFAVYALYERPQAFHSIIAASPSLEWNEQGILDNERAFTARLQDGGITKSSRLMLVVGDRDTDDDPEPARALAERLDRLSGRGMRVRLLRYPDEAHMGVPTRAVNDAMRFAFEIR